MEEKVNDKKDENITSLNENFKKVLWIALPVFIGISITFFAGARTDIQIICYGVLIVISLLGIWITNVTAYRRRREKEERAWREELIRRLDRGDKANRVILRKELVKGHEKYVQEKGCITLEAKSDLKNTYDVYHEIDGNGLGTDLWNDIDELPIVSREGDSK